LRLLPAATMDNFLLNKWNGYNFGKTFAEIANGDDMYTNDPYFFLDRELDYTNRKEWLEAKRNGLIRHVKPYRKKWLDYVVGKEFNTLQEWVTDCGGTLDDVRYGVNRVHQTNWRGQPLQAKLVCLSHFLRQIGYEEARHINVPVGKVVSCRIENPDGSTVIGSTINKWAMPIHTDRQYIHDIIRFPMTKGKDEYYYCPSEMPKGTKVVFSYD